MLNKYYEIKPHQKQIIKDVNKLNLRNLHYLVIQQDENQRNFTLNELKRHIRYGIKSYAKSHYSYNYKQGLENDLIQYYTFFETSKEFNVSQLKNTLIDEEFNMNLHFHLFISSPKNMVYIPAVINEIIFSFFNQKLKARALKKIDYLKLDKLDENFILYHTKQMPDQIRREMILTNLN